MKRAFLAAVLMIAGCGGPRAVDTPAVPLLPSTNPVTSATAPTATSPVPTKPTAYVQRNWVAEVSTPDRPSTLVMAVPAGWPERPGDTYWSDFTDPTGRIRMRVDVTGVFGRAPLLGARAMADRHLGRVRDSAGYRLISEKPLPSSDFGDANLEVVYRYLRAGEEVEATYHFTGTTQITNLELSVHYPLAHKDVALMVLGNADRSAAWLGRR